MGENVSRRDFLKTTSISAAGVTALSFKPLSASFSPTQDESRIIIATDDECLVGSTINEAKVQDMVDYSIMTLTKIADKPKAYEALFPDGVTTDTTILIKYNNAKTNSSKSQKAVRDALLNGLTSMIGGTFPSDNITEMGKQTGSSTSETFDVGTKSFSIAKPWVDCDYFINLPSAWNISYTGITMALKGMMPSVSGSQSGFHNYFTSESDPGLSILNSQPSLKNKQVLVLLDAISICPSGNTVKAAYKIVASKDMVAADYQGMLIMKEDGLSSSDETTAKKVCELAALPDYGLGTDDPSEMEIVNIGPPWTTEIFSSGNVKVKAKDFQVKTQSKRTVFSSPGGQATIAIFDTQGRRVWADKSSENRIVWNNINLHGHKVSSGMYLYQLKVGKVIAQGKIAVK